MSRNEPEFDKFSATYDELLRDPIRDRFGAGGSEFFHVRKRDLIRAYFRQRNVDTSTLSWLDVGCGKGELLTLLAPDFARASGCDPSAGMIEEGGLRGKGIDARVMETHDRIPFPDAQFDFVTAVCVYHHVPPPVRGALTSEIRRTLKPGGTFAIVEHNPWNPATRLIVSRAPVDADAILLTARESQALLRNCGLEIDSVQFFLYLPRGLYQKMGRLESALASVPLGGQYAAFAKEA